MKRCIAIILMLVICCGSALAAETRTFFAMDTYMTITAPSADEGLIDECVSQVLSLESQISVTRPGSAVYTLNAEGSAVFEGDAPDILEFALDACEMTGGALDITMYPVIREWGFTTGEYSVPEHETVEFLLSRTGYGCVSVDGGTVSLPEGYMIDLGSVAKGYASDMVAGTLRAGGVKSALIDLGGNIYCIGTKEDGSLWRIGLRDPLSEGYIGVVSVSDRAVVTSGCYERYFEEDGVRYGHIFDPATGYPADNGLISVTVIGESGAMCDALSTALYVMGPDAAAEYLAMHTDIEAVMVRDDGSLIITEGLKAAFIPMGGYENAETEWIR